MLLSGFVAHITVNSELVKTGEVRSVQDLLKPQYKAKIVMFDPSVSGSSSNWMAYLLIDVLGLEKGNPELPAINENGVPGYETSTWNGVMVAAGTPAPIVAKLHAEITAVLRSPDLRKQLEEQSLVVVGNTPEEFGAFLRAETTKWAAVVRNSGARIQ